MVGKGTYSEFLRSGIDFASLLKKEEEAEQPSVPGTPNLKSSRSRTFSESSVWSQDSSVHSVKDGAAEQPPVSAQRTETSQFLWGCVVAVVFLTQTMRSALFWLPLHFSECWIALAGESWLVAAHNWWSYHMSCRGQASHSSVHLSSTVWSHSSLALPSFWKTCTLLFPVLWQWYFKGPIILC